MKSQLMVGQSARFRHRPINVSGFSLHSPRSHSVLCLILGLILGNSSANALNPTSSFEEYTATTWSHRDGLLSTFIRSIVQTADGYIWLGTTDGLFRFDGVRFFQWHTKSPERRGLGVVNALCGTRDGSLWV